VIDTVIDTANGPWSHGRHEDEHDWPFVAVSSPFRPRLVAIWSRSPPRRIAISSYHPIIASSHHRIVASYLAIVLSFWFSRAGHQILSMVSHVTSEHAASRYGVWMH